LGAVVVGLQRRNRDGWFVLAVVVGKRERERAGLLMEEER